MKQQIFVLAAGALTALCIYLFVTAPPPLQPPVETAKDVSVQLLFEVLAVENDAVRGLYTREIVGPGKKVQLAFDEDWSKPSVHAGPLPALFLRGVAQQLERSPVPVSLFLGSDFPIEAANSFDGAQVEAFRRVKSEGEPQFFFDETTNRHTAMFADLAIAGPCVNCHNEHSGSPKTDWELGDVMGATTWQYPADKISLAEALAAVWAFRESARHVYEVYLEDSREFDDPPEIGDCWPSERRCLPSSDVFMHKATSLASPHTMAALLAAQVGGDQE